MKAILLGIIVVGCVATSCGNKQNEKTLSGIDPQNFKKEIKGKQADLFVLKNKNGMEVCITNFGGRIVSIMVPDKSGKLQDVVLGFNNVDDYVNIPTDFGATIGRYANRIANGIIEIDGERIQLPQNNFGHTLHGGPDGWQYRMFDAKLLNPTTLELSLVSPDGDENFPGKVNAKVIYKLTDDNAIDISYSATTDKKTVINMTNHSYFNLSGDASKSITDHVLYVNSSEFTPVDSTFMTTGEIVTVSGTPMDFSSPKVIGNEIDNFDYEQLKNGNGYDHNWILDTKGNINQVAARLESPTSGIVMEMYTDEPGVQVYTGNFLDGTVKGKNDVTYNMRAAVCLETQHYPDSPNKAEWPSVILEPGQTYTSHCIYKFSVK